MKPIPPRSGRARSHPSFFLWGLCPFLYCTTFLVYRYVFLHFLFASHLSFSYVFIYKNIHNRFSTKQLPLNRSGTRPWCPSLSDLLSDGLLCWFTLLWMEPLRLPYNWINKSFGRVKIFSHCYDLESAFSFSLGNMGQRSSLFDRSNKGYFNKS